MAQSTNVQQIPRYYVTMSYLYGVLDYLKQTGVPLQPVLDALCLTAPELEEPDRLLPAIAFDVLSELGAILTGDPLFGFHAGSHMRPGHMGIVGHLMMCCETADELLQLMVRHGQLVANGVDIQLETTGDQVRLSLAPPEDRREYSRQANEFNLTGWLALCRWLGGPDLAPDFIELNYLEETDYGPVRDFARCEIRFGAPKVCLGFSQQFVRRAFMQGNNSMKPALEAVLRERLQLLQSQQRGLDPLLARLRQLIADRLIMGAPELQDVAAAAGESGRRLQYFLDSRGTHFTQVVDEVRQEMAAQHLRQRELSLVDVALMLGFSDQTTFHRAFKRWYGVAPGVYRKKLLSV